MSRSISWIDRSRFQTLLGEAVVGRTTMATMFTARKAPAVAAPSIAVNPPFLTQQRQQSVPAQAGTSVKPKRQTLPYRPAAGGVEERAQALIEWVTACFACASCFVADDHGLAVIERNSAPEHLAVCATMIATLDEVRPLLSQPHDSMSIVLDAERVLCCIVEKTDLGRLTVGVVQEQELRITERRAVAGALRKAFSEQETHE